MGSEDEEWRRYEDYIGDRLREWAGDDAIIETDKKVVGVSGVSRQLDFFVTAGYGGGIAQGVTAVIDCKHYTTRKVTLPAMDGLHGMVEDVGADLGIIISESGYTAGAGKRQRRGIKVMHVPKVLVARPDDLPVLYTPDYGEPYYEGDFFDHSPPSHAVGAVIQYHYPEGDYQDGDDPAAIDWLDDPVASSWDGELDWGTPETTDACARVVLRHYLGEEPDNDTVQLFLDEIGGFWEVGQPWVVHVGELRHAGIDR